MVIICSKTVLLLHVLFTADESNFFDVFENAFTGI